MFNTSLLEPSDPALDALLRDQRGEVLDYPGTGGTARGRSPAGFRVRCASVELGRGRDVWRAAREALSAWRAFPPAWTRVRPGPGALRPGLDVVVAIRALGLWWTAPSRVGYVDDEPRRRAFACGTLPAHPESGEERFSVEWRPDDTVVFELRSFSRPRLWAARLAAPVAGALQDRFVRASLAAMRAAVEASA